LKATTVFGETGTLPPVFGFLATRAFRRRNPKMPNSQNSMRLPFANSSIASFPVTRAGAAARSTSPSMDAGGPQRGIPSAKGTGLHPGGLLQTHHTPLLHPAERANIIRWRTYWGVMTQIRSAPKDIAAFLDRYAALKIRHASNRYQAFTSGFELIRSHLLYLEQRHRQRLRATAATFNLFRVLGLQRKEVTTHTPFLAELLDPGGSHGQGSLFLHGFLDRYAAKSSSVERPTTGWGCEWIVERERHTSLGQIDIVIRAADDSLLVVVENKIDAREGLRQLPRYHTWIKGQGSYDRTALIFLTPRGRASKDDGEADYSKLSYHEDIVPWLEDSLLHVRAPRFRDTLEQYLEIVRTI
jgi:hypothetical protein